MKSPMFFILIIASMAASAHAAELECGLSYGEISLPYPASKSIQTTHPKDCDDAPGCGMYEGQMTLKSDHATAQIEFEHDLRMTLNSEGQESTTWIDQMVFATSPVQILEQKTKPYSFKGHKYNSVTLRCQIITQ
jgi:hypothetical protein